MSRHKFHINQTFLLVCGLIIGTMICVFSPGTLHRAGGDSSIQGMLLHKFGALFYIFSEVKAFYFLLVLIFIKFCTLPRTFLRWGHDFCRGNLIIIISIFLSFLIVLISGTLVARGAIGIELFSIILCLKIINSFNLRMYYGVSTLLVVPAFILYIFIVKYSWINYKNMNNVWNQIEQTTKQIILFDDIRFPSVIQNYIHVTSNMYKLSDNYKLFQNDSITRIFLPRSIFIDIINDSEKLQDIKYQNEYIYYVVPETHSDSKGSPYFELRDTRENEIPFYLRPLKNLLSRFTISELEVEEFKRIKVNDRYYIIIKKNPSVDSRVENIKFK